MVGDWCLGGRWDQQDQTGFKAGDTNLDRVCGNDPVNATDPSGLDYITPENPAPGQTVFLHRTYYLTYAWTGNTDATIPIGTVRLINGRLYLKYGGVCAPLELATAAAIDSQGGWKDTSQVLAWFNANPQTDFSSTVGSGWQTEFGVDLYGTRASLEREGHDFYRDQYITGLYFEAAPAAAAGAIASLKQARAAQQARAGARAAAQNARGGPGRTLSCFTAGTLVATSEGFRQIETVQPGDQVWSFDVIKTEWRLCRIVEPFSRPYEGTLVLVTIAGETTEATYQHPFWVVSGDDLADRPRPQHLAVVPEDATMKGRWVDSCDLRLGDDVLLRDGRMVPVERLEHRLFVGSVYNMEVDGLHCYTVGRNSVLVHNSNGPGTGPVPTPAPIGGTAHVPTGAMKGKRIGHTFSKHGSHNTHELTQEAVNSKRPQGQWLDDAAAEEFIASKLPELKQGAKTFDLPPGVGRVINPDGTFSPANKARLVPSKTGVDTAFPMVE